MMILFPPSSPEGLLWFGTGGNGWPPLGESQRRRREHGGRLATGGCGIPRNRPLTALSDLGLSAVGRPGQARP